MKNDNTETEKPKRRYELDLHLGADSLESLRGAINSILFDIDRHPVDTPIDIVSGGYDSGYSLKCAVDTSITHDSWYEQLKVYLENTKHG